MPQQCHQLFSAGREISHLCPLLAFLLCRLNPFSSFCYSSHFGPCPKSGTSCSHSLKGKGVMFISLPFPLPHPLPLKLSPSALAMSFDNRSSFDSVDLEAATSTFQSRSAPDVPEDVDLLLEHVGDPNMDLSQFRRRPSRHPEAIELEFQTRPSKAYTFSVTDVASHIETATSPTVKDIPIQMPSTSQEEDVDFNE